MPGGGARRDARARERSRRDADEGVVSRSHQATRCRWSLVEVLSPSIRCWDLAPVLPTLVGCQMLATCNGDQRLTCPALPSRGECRPQADVHENVRESRVRLADPYDPVHHVVRDHRSGPTRRIGHRRQGQSTSPCRPRNSTSWRHRPLHFRQRQHARHRTATTVNAPMLLVI
jgi:hypothetical protein